MKKILFFLISILLVVSIAACQNNKRPQLPSDDSKNNAVNPSESSAQLPNSNANAGTTGDSTVDSIGNDIKSIDSANNELSTDDLSDLDSGLADIQNI